jgi:plastocyanin
MKRLILAGLFASRLGAATYTVTVAFPSFSPSSLTVSAGDTIHWTGLSGHNVAESANDTSNSYSGGFYSGAVSAVTTFDLTLSAGTYYYICEAHAATFNMRGALFVVPGPVPTAVPLGLPGVLGPVPQKRGDPLCLKLAQPERSILCELYNPRGEIVARDKSYAAAQACLSTQGLAAGMYFARVETEDAALAHLVRLQKIVLLP